MLNAAYVWTGTPAGAVLPRMTGHDVTGDSLQLSHVIQPTSCSCIKCITGLLGHLCRLVGAERGGGLCTLGDCVRSLG